jgi:hypothetical protein
VVGWSELFCLFIPMYLLTLRTMMLHLSHDLIVSSHFITVLGGDDVDLEVIFLGDLEKTGKTIFQSRG